MSITITTNMGLKKPDQNTREPASIFATHNPNVDAMDAHDHSSGKGVGIRRVQAGSTPAAAGELQVTGDAFRWWGATAAAVRTALDAESAQTVTGAKTFGAQIVSALGTVTADTPNVSATATWNNAAVAFTALKLNVTDSASHASSKLLDLQVGGTSAFSVLKNGEVGVRLAGVSAWLNRTEASAQLMRHLDLRRNGAYKVGLGLDAGDNLAVLGSAGNNVLLTLGVASSAGNLGLGATPHSGWGSTHRAFQVGQRGVFYANATTDGVALANNTYYDGAQNRALVNAAATYVALTGDSVSYWRAASVAADEVQTFTKYFSADASWIENRSGAWRSYDGSSAMRVEQVSVSLPNATQHTLNTPNGGGFNGFLMVHNLTMGTGAMYAVTNSTTVNLVWSTGSWGTTSGAANSSGTVGNNLGQMQLQNFSGGGPYAYRLTKMYHE